MNRYRSINIRLDQSELDALLAAAESELRHPRDQARLILRTALGLDSPRQHNGTVSSGLGNRENGAAVSLPG